MIDFSKPFSTFEDGKLNGATCYIMQSAQEQEEYNEAIEILSEAVNEKGHLLKDKYEIKSILSDAGIWLDGFSYSTKERIIREFTD